MEYVKLLAGIVFLLGALIGLHRAWNYHSKIQGVGRSISKKLLVSLILFVLGILSTIADSVTEGSLWGLQGTFYTLSYLLVFFTLFQALQVLASPSFRLYSPEKTQKQIPLTGGHIIETSPSPLTFRILRDVSYGLLVVSRRPYDKWIESTGIKPDKFIWLSRTGLGDAVDPSKLHILHNEIVSFLERRKFACVYLEGIEYLTLYNEFPSVAKFLFSLKDSALINNSLIIIQLSRGILAPQAESILSREFHPITEEILLKEFLKGLPERKKTELVFREVLMSMEKRGEESHASTEGSKERSGAGKEKAEETQPLRREEATEE